MQVSSLSKEALTKLFQDDPSIIRKMRQTKNIVEKAVTANYKCLRFVRKQTPDLILKAISVNSEALHEADINEFDERVWMKAIKICTDYYFMHPDPTNRMKIWMLLFRPHYKDLIKCPPQEVLSTYIAENPYVIKLIKNPTDEQRLKAMRYDPRVYEIFENPTEEETLLLVTMQPTLIRLVKFPSQELIMTAITYNVKAISCFPNPPIKLAKFAVNLDVQALSYITPQTDEICWYGLKKSPAAVSYIRNLTMEQLRFALQGDVEWHKIESLGTVSKVLIYQYLKMYPEDSNKVIPLLRQDGYLYPTVLFFATPEIIPYSNARLVHNLAELRKTVLEEDCPVCHDNQGVVTHRLACSHVLCPTCILKIMDTTGQTAIKCPLCRFVNE